MPSLTLTQSARQPDGGGAFSRPPFPLLRKVERAVAPSGTASQDGWVWKAPCEQGLKWFVGVRCLLTAAWPYRAPRPPGWLLCRVLGCPEHSGLPARPG